MMRQTRNTYYMREDYIKLIKEYVTSKPDYKLTLNEIKSSVLTLGATEQEFEEALKQLSIVHQSQPIPISQQMPAEQAPTKQPPKQEEGKKSKFVKRLIEFDIATHTALIIVIVLFGSVYLISPLFKDNGVPIQEKISENLTNLQNNLSKFQVYAHTQPVDGTKIFSYPKSNVTLIATGKPKKDVYGFMPYWMLNVEEKITLSPLTTIGLFGLEVDSKGNIVTKNGNELDGGWGMWTDSRLDTFIRRARARGVKIELVLKAFNNENIEKLVLSNNAQKTFISNAIQLVNSRSLDGINLDFEYVGDPSPNVREGFTRLVINLKSELARQVPKSTVTIDTYIHSASVKRLFDVHELEPYTDAFIIMGYDVHTPKGEPGPLAPMEGPFGIIGSVQSFLEKVPPEKIILALAYYGYDWPRSGGNESQTKIIPYAELAAASKNTTIQWDETSQTPWYSYTDPDSRISRRVHFENSRSLGIKYDYVNQKDLKGIGIWALGYDGLNADLRHIIIEKF